MAGALCAAAPAHATDDDDPYGDVPAQTASAASGQVDLAFSNLFASMDYLFKEAKTS